MTSERAVRPSNRAIRVGLAMVVVFVASGCGSTGGASTSTTTAPVTPTTAASTSTTAIQVDTGSSTAAPPPTEPSTTVAPTTTLPDPLDGLTIRVDHVVEFAAGGTSTTVQGAVIRGERDIYRIGALQGQTLQISVSSPENNAVFDIFAPDGALIGMELMTSETVLPMDGDYLVVVGGTSGNATYELLVSIPA